MKKKIMVHAWAKINLSLNVCGKNTSGMHLLDSVTASVSLADAVTVCLGRGTGLTLKYDGEERRYKNDAVVRAVESVEKRFGKLGLDISVEKKLPEGAGLGGSSADAAAVLYALDKLCGIFDRGYTLGDVRTIGSDVPVMIAGGYNRLVGAGENFTPFTAPTLHFVLLCGGSGVSTVECFKLFDEMYESGTYAPADNDILIKALEAGDLRVVASHCKNALYAPAARSNPQIEERIEALKATGALCSFMTGSGSACLGLFADAPSAKTAAEKLKESPASCEALYVHTVSKNIE